MSSFSSDPCSLRSSVPSESHLRLPLLSSSGVTGKFRPVSDRKLERRSNQGGWKGNGEKRGREGRGPTQNDDGSVRLNNV